MNEKINQYLDGVFAPYDGVKSVAELKADLLADLQERFQELKAEGIEIPTGTLLTKESVRAILRAIACSMGWTTRPAWCGWCCSTSRPNATRHGVCSRKPMT